MNNFAMKNSNTNAGDLWIGVRAGKKTNGERRRVPTCESRGE